MQTNHSFYERVINASLYSEFRDYYDPASKAPQGWETKIARLLDPIFSTLSSTYRKRKADLSHRLMMMAEAKQKFDHVRKATEPVLTRQDEKAAGKTPDMATGLTSEPLSPQSSAPDQGDVIIDMPMDEKIDAMEIDDIYEEKQDSNDLYSDFYGNYAKIFHGEQDILFSSESIDLSDQEEAELEDPWVKAINDSPETPLYEYYDLSTFFQVEDFLMDHGSEITALNLLHIDLDDAHVERLIGLCPILEHLTVGQSSKFKGDALASLKGLPLRSIVLCHHHDLTDDKLEVLKELPLESVKFNGSSKLTDKTLEFLKGKPLHTAQFYWCKLITDSGLENLKGMPLEKVFFGGCPQLTDRGLDNFEGMALREISFAETQVTDQGLKIFLGMPLEYVDFEACPNLTQDALAEFKKSVKPLE